MGIKKTIDKIQSAFYWPGIQSAWSTNSVTVEELSECPKHKLEPFEQPMNGLQTAIL